MPLVYRAMKRSEDGLPIVDQTAAGLGVRAHVDIDVVNDAVEVNGKGMSVSPTWRVISIARIPKRLRDKVPGARGSNATACFRYGSGPFEAGPFAEGLNLLPDTPHHGCVTPVEPVPLARFEADLAATRSGWQVDEV